MLKNLSIQNIALVDNLDLTFDPGLLVLSGETGAGKSVIVTAVALVLGGRAEKEYIRQGFKSASVEAKFDVSSMPTRYKKEFAEYLTSNSLFVRRDLTRDGQSRVKIKGELSSVARLRELTDPIAEIVGQHASQMLMNEDNHLLFLDSFAGLDESRHSVGQIYTQWEATHRELKRIVGRRDQLAQERELLLFQKNEILQAEIRDGEENELLQERRILDSSRALMEASANIVEALDGEEVSALQLLRTAGKELDKMAEIDDSLVEKASELVEADFKLSEIRQFVEQYGSSVPDDPARLEEINHRLDELYRLKKKYGGSEQSILETLRDIETQLNNRPEVDHLIEELESRSNELRKQYSVEACALSDARTKAAAYLKTIVEKELAELAIENGVFEFEFSYTEHPDGVILGDRAVKPFDYGLENGRILFSANPGEKAQSLVKTASGGELSRVLLALKAAESRQRGSAHQLLVFDEVDAGIGGQTANDLATKLKKLSAKRQVLVITHLHQIARLANYHYVAEKTVQKGRAVISVRRLDGEQRMKEIDRMVALPEDK